MNLPDIKRIIQIIEKIHLKENRLHLSERRDYIANQYVHDATVKAVIDTLKGIENGNIRLDDEE